MKHIAAVLLLALGNKEITEANINAVIKSVGGKPDDKAVKALATYCKGKKVEDIIKEGSSKLGAVVCGASPADSHADVKKDDKKGKKDDKKDKKETKKEEKKEEEDEDIGFGDLF